MYTKHTASRFMLGNTDKLLKIIRTQMSPSSHKHFKITSSHCVYNMQYISNYFKTYIFHLIFNIRSKTDPKSKASFRFLLTPCTNSKVFNFIVNTYLPYPVGTSKHKRKFKKICNRKCPNFYIATVPVKGLHVCSFISCSSQFKLSTHQPQYSWRVLSPWKVDLQ